MAKKTGRKPTLTDDMIKRVCGQIKKGNYAKHACAACGISQSIYYKWKQQGDEDRLADPPRRTKYVQFLESIEHAESVAQQRLVEMVIRKGGYKGPLEILKRRWPKEWGDKTTLSSGTAGNPLPTPDTSGAPVTLQIRFGNEPDDNPFTDEEAEAKAAFALMAPPTEPTTPTDPA